MGVGVKYRFFKIEKVGKIDLIIQTSIDIPNYDIFKLRYYVGHDQQVIGYGWFPDVVELILVSLHKINSAFADPAKWTPRCRLRGQTSKIQACWIICGPTFSGINP